MQGGPDSQPADPIRLRPFAEATSIAIRFWWGAINNKTPPPACLPALCLVRSRVRARSHYLQPAKVKILMQIVSAS
jgi:hypothetical protein